MKKGYKLTISAALLLLILLTGNMCRNSKPAEAQEHRIAVVDPGHFHAALVTKSPLAGINDTVSVYAPEGEGLDSYKNFIESYNGRQDNPTSWILDIHAGDNFMDGLTADSLSDIVVLAGNNQHKTDYILTAVMAGKNVLADKPMAIDRNGYNKLRDAYQRADADSLVIYELMTERYDTLNIAVRNLINDTTAFGTLVTAGDEPAVSMKSVHHFYKEVSGSPLVRPEWYYDVEQQGEGIADVTTHLLDLIMWQCFPGEAVTENDVEIVDAEHTATLITPEQFKMSTGGEIENPIEVYSNGYILARIKGVLVKLEVQWDFEAPEGSGDTFSAVYRGTRGNVEVCQDLSTDFVKQLYTVGADSTRSLVEIPAEARLGHEDHFNRVTESFLGILDGAEMPAWETANTLTKYYITTGAVELARSKKAE